jgi:hypothetical protein
MTSSAPIRLRPCIIIALELLGLNEDDVRAIQLRRILALLDRDFGNRETFERRVLVAGHRVFRLSPILPDRVGALPFRELLDVVHLQADLLGHGILVRGAVTLGKAAWHTDMAVGAGISEAERLCQLAEVPRVIVDPRLLREVESNENLRDHVVLTELGYIRELLRQDSDGLWFVDYLRAIATELDEPDMYPEFLKDHRTLIEKRLGDCVTLDRTSRVSTWLWRYHNRGIDECARRGVLDDAAKAELRLPAQSPVVYVFPPSAKAPG